MHFSMNTLRRWSRNIHRELSFFFAGILIIYAISGIVMNHRNSINLNYSIERKEYRVQVPLPSQEEIKKTDVLSLLKPIGEEVNYTKHYFPRKGIMKVFLKGGSNLVVDIHSGQTTYESVTKRPFLSAITRLHYNPGHWWTWFSDIFAVSLLIITFTGFLIIKGKKGLWGIGGIELLIGILIPLVFLLCG
ncbi:peptidase [Bacteroides sp. AF16-49]|nr:MULTISPECIES: PepSY-associated TM helix domain-containing protein [unclassified Bacteroides]RGN49899.1 peptidase [Bacteroides sp. OM05-12]RHR81493.1 peptidase [Bacteroides sp. AF16-49]